MESAKAGAPKGPPIAVIVAAAVVFFCSLGFAAWFVGFRDTWESDNAPHIRTLSEDAVALAHGGHPEEAIAKHEELKATLGDHKLSDATLIALVAQADAATAEAQQLVELRKRDAENRRQESERLAEVARLEVAARQAEESNDLSGAINLYDKALVLASDAPTANSGFSEARSRIISRKDPLVQRVAAENKRQAEAEAAAAEETRLSRIRVALHGGAWVTKAGGTSDPLRGLQVYVLQRWATVGESKKLRALMLQGARARLQAAKESSKRAGDLLERMRANKAIYPDDLMVRAAKLAESSAKDELEYTIEVKKNEEALKALQALPDSSRVDVVSLCCDFATEPDPDEGAAWAAFLSRQAAATGHADVDGKYRIEIPGGSFCVYARFDSSLWTIRWSVPLDVVEEKDQALDLRNENADEIRNHSD